MKLTVEGLLKHLSEKLEVEAETDTPLFSSGLLDSVTMLSLIEFIERSAQIEVEREDVTLENFDTATRIVNYANNKA